MARLDLHGALLAPAQEVALGVRQGHADQFRVGLHELVQVAGQFLLTRSGAVDKVRGVSLVQAVGGVAGEDPATAPQRLHHVVAFAGHQQAHRHGGEEQEQASQGEQDAATQPPRREIQVHGLLATPGRAGEPAANPSALSR